MVYATEPHIRSRAPKRVEHSLYQISIRFYATSYTTPHKTVSGSAISPTVKQVQELHSRVISPLPVRPTRLVLQ